MLISHRKKFIYTKTVRTASTSVESYFEKYCMPEGLWKYTHSRKEYVSGAGIIGFRVGNSFPFFVEGILRDHRWWHHMPAKIIKRQIGDEIWNSYFKFCVIRNPFDKLISAFYRQEKVNETFVGRLRKIKRSIKKQQLPIDLTNGDTEIQRFRNWIKNGGRINDRDKYVLDGSICMDYFIRFENLKDDIKTVCDKLEVQYEPDEIPWIKNSRRSDIPLSEYYDSESIEIVKDIYRFELNEFGYQIPF